MSLLIESWKQSGLPVEEAAEKTAGIPFVRRQFQRSQAKGKWGDLSDLGEMLRTGYYYPFRKKWPQLESAVGLWRAAFAVWCVWARTADPRLMRSLSNDTLKRDEREDAEAFLLLVADVKKVPTIQDPFKISEEALQKTIATNPRLSGSCRRWLCRSNATRPIGSTMGTHASNDNVPHSP